MTPEQAAERAAEILAIAEHADNDRAIALVAVGDAWTRLHTALDNAPKEIEPVSEISIYSERARLIAYLASQFPAVIAYNDPNEPDWPVIYFATGHGQLSWHLSPDDMHLFPHVSVVEDVPAVVWDGHTTAEKYERLARLTFGD